MHFYAFSTIFTALFFPYIPHERFAQNLILSVRSSLFFLLSAIAPKMQVRSRAIERFQSVMGPALRKCWALQATHKHKLHTQVLGGLPSTIVFLLSLSLPATVVWVVFSCRGAKG